MAIRKIFIRSPSDFEKKLPIIIFLPRGFTFLRIWTLNPTYSESSYLRPYTALHRVEVPTTSFALLAQEAR